MDKLTARVFPNLHKEIILGIPWLVKANPNIDWTAGRVTVERKQSILHLPLVPRKKPESVVQEVNLCTAKQMAKWFRKGTVERAFVTII